MLRKVTLIVILVVLVSVVLSGCSFVANVVPAPKPAEQEESQTETQPEETQPTPPPGPSVQPSEQSQQQTSDYLFTLSDVERAIVKHKMPIDALIGALSAAGINKVVSLGFILRGAANSPQSQGAIFSMELKADGHITPEQAQAIVGVLDRVGQVTSTIIPSAENGYMFEVVAEVGGYQVNVGYPGEGDQVNTAIVPPADDKSIGVIVDFSSLGLNNAQKVWKVMASVVDEDAIAYSIGLEGDVPRTSFTVFHLTKDKMDSLLTALKNTLNVSVGCMSGVCGVDGEDMSGGSMQVSDNLYVFSMEVYR